MLVCIASDLHGMKDYGAVVSEIEKKKPDMVLIPGDLMVNCEKDAEMLRFLKLCSEICETYYSTGNHERLSESDKTKIEKTGAVLLCDEYRKTMGLYIGGLASGGSSGSHINMFSTPAPNLDFLREFDLLDGMKILISHHPEYYRDFIQATGVELTVSGHAHGGQWRFFGQGIYAPGQGIFPKLTAGVIENRLVISRGLTNHSKVPRIFNPPELVFLRILPENR